MKDYYTTNSHLHTYIQFFLKGWENILFELGSERVRDVSYTVLTIGIGIIIIDVVVVIIIVFIVVMVVDTYQLYG